MLRLIIDPFGIDVLVVVITSQLAIDQLHTADFNNPVTLGGFQTGGFCIEYNLSHAVLFLFNLLDALRRVIRRCRGWPTDRLSRFPDDHCGP